MADLKENNAFDQKYNNNNHTSAENGDSKYERKKQNKKFTGRQNNNIKKNIKKT